MDHITVCAHTSVVHTWVLAWATDRNCAIGVDRPETVVCCICGMAVAVDCGSSERYNKMPIIKYISDTNTNLL